MQRFDKYWIGILIGLLAPALFCYAYIETYHLWSVLKAFSIGEGSVMSKILILSSFPDMALLFLFYQTDTWKLAKGIMIGAFPFAIAAIWCSM